MKACPTCKRTYGDETLTFCLADGSLLSAPYDPHETLRIPATRATDPAPTEIMNPTPPDSRRPALSTIQATPPQFPHSAPRPARTQKQGSKVWLVIGVIVSLGLIVVVASILVLVSLSASDSQSDVKVVNANARPTATPTPYPTASPTATVADGGWGPRNDQASLNGERITYYPTTTPDACQADCERNPACKGFTFIRAGAYNPTDSAMCYPMRVVTEIVPHQPCCISAVKE